MGPASVINRNEYEMRNWILGVVFAFICTTIDSWSTWALLVTCGIALLACLIWALADEVRKSDPSDRDVYTSDTPIADFLDRKYGRNND